MILIADSGSTKTDWRLLQPSGQYLCYTSIGINPLHVPADQLHQLVAGAIPPDIPRAMVSKVFFYGAGCAHATMASALQEALLACLPNTGSVEVHPDLLAAGRALFSDNPGLVGVLGTGSSCAVYNGQRITSTANSLGYMLGDEGGGVDLGKRLLRAFFYGQLPLGVHQRLAAQGITRQAVLQQLYHSPQPARFLSQFTGFILQHRQDPTVAALVRQSMSEFIEYHVQPLHQPGLPLGIVGSVGSLFAPILLRLLAEYGFSNVEILQYPIDRLVSYHIYAK